MKNSAIFWFTGLSGAGKSTIAELAKKKFEAKGNSVCIIDGDDVRAKLNKNLSFSKEDIITNNKVVIELCQEKRREFNLIIVSVISPLLELRSLAREKLSPHYYEIYFSANLQTVASRDIKGLYDKTAKGEITDMIGMGGVNYEVPPSPDLVINSAVDSMEVSIEQFIKFAEQKIISYN